MSEIIQKGQQLIIQGYVQLKRKLEWVTRYAQVENQLFSYKKQKTDKSMRQNVDLRTSTIKYSTRVPNIYTYNHYISIETPNNEKIFLEFSVIEEFDKWVDVLKNQTQFSKSSALKQTTLQLTEIEADSGEDFESVVIQGGGQNSKGGDYNTSSPITGRVQEKAKKHKALKGLVTQEVGEQLKSQFQS